MDNWINIQDKEPPEDRVIDHYGKILLHLIGLLIISYIIFRLVKQVF